MFLTTDKSAASKQLLSSLQSPEFQTNSLQVLKSVVAATAGWWLSVNVLESAMPFMAPWTALLTVHATAYRSFSRGAQTTVATGLGVALSFLIGSFLGVSLWTFALALVIGLAASYVVWIRDEGVAIATTAIFILGTGFDSEAPFLDDRLMEVGLGVSIGILVNVLMMPPLRGQQASLYIDRLDLRVGEALISIAEATAVSWPSDQTEAWIDDTRSIDEELSAAWQTVRFARESERMNPRNWLNQRFRGYQDVEHEDILERLGEAIAHLRHLARILGEATYVEDDWDDEFRTRWAATVASAGQFIKDPDLEVEPISDRLDKLADDFSSDGLSVRNWTIYGALITSIRQITVIADDVASAHRKRQEVIR